MNSGKILYYVIRAMLQRKNCFVLAETEGVRKSDVVAWYLEQIQDQIESEEELVTKKQLVEGVLNRLAYHDHVIIPLTRTGLRGEDHDEEDPLLVVHPNYIINI